MRPFKPSNLRPKFQKSRSHTDIEEDPFPYFVSDPCDACDTVPLSSISGGRSGKPDQDDQKQSQKPNSKLTHAKHLTRLRDILGLADPYSNFPKIEAQTTLDEMNQTQAKQVVQPGKAIPVSPPLRGRPAFRGDSSSRTPIHGKGGSRRPHVWRAPSEDLWPVEEEQDQVGLGITNDG